MAMSSAKKPSLLFSLARQPLIERFGIIRLFPYIMAFIRHLGVMHLNPGGLKLLYQITLPFDRRLLVLGSVINPRRQMPYFLHLRTDEGTDWDDGGPAIRIRLRQFPHAAA